MLKTLYSSFIVCVIAEVGFTQKQEVGKITDYLHHKCMQNGKAEVFNKLNADLTDFLSYFDHAATLIPNNMGIFCDRERQQLSLRIKEISNDLEPCLSSDEKFLASFVNDSFNEFIHFLCHKNAKYTKNLFSAEGQQCQEALFAKQEGEVSDCFNRIFPPRSRAVTKSEMCSNINIAKECLSRSNSKLCPNAKNFQEVSEKLFDYISKPCSACSHYLNISLLSMSIVLSYLFSR